MGTQPTPAPIPNTACQTTTAGSCGVRTFTASQLGSLLALPLGALLFKVGGNLHELGLQFLVVYLLTFAYHTTTAWKTEEEMFLELQNLPSFAKWFEFLIRVAQVACFATAAAGLPQEVLEMLHVDMTRMEASYCFLAFIFWTCLVWDITVVWSHLAIPIKLIIFDFLGGVFLLGLLWLPRHYPDGAYVLVIIFAMTIGMYLRGVRWGRLARRAELR